MYYEAYCYATDGAQKDIQKAILWYQKAAEEGHGKAMVALGEIYRKGNGVPKDIGKAFLWYEKSANAGCIDSMVYCGNAYKIGDRVLQDLEKAEQWYQKAFDKGNHRGKLGLFSLGCMYEKRNNRTKAMRIYEKLAKSNNVSPPSFSLWISGILFPFQPPPSIITDIMRQTDENSTYDLARRGYAYEHGMAGVEKDWNKALEWYQKAADAGDIYSMVVLGDVYSKGELQDEEKAFGYFRQAAMIGCGNQN